MQKSSKCIFIATTAILAILVTPKSALAEATIDSTVRPYFIGGGVVTAIFFISVGAILIRRGQRYLRIAAAAAQWPIVKGKVIFSDITKRVDRTQDGPSAVFVPQVRYVYNADEVSREGRVIRAGLEERGHSLEQQARDYVAKYSVGSRVPVRYDPQNPADAVLELGQIGAGNNLLAGILLMLVGIGSVAFTIFSVVAPSS